VKPTSSVVYQLSKSTVLVPPGVLSVLPGYGAITGKEIVSNALIRKVDITVSHIIRDPRVRILNGWDRLGRRQVALWVALLGPTWPRTLLSWAARFVQKQFISVVAHILPQAPVVVFNDADVINAVNGAAFASFIASGQTCVSGTRLIIQDGVYDEFMAHFLEKVASITRRMGDRELVFLYPRLVYRLIVPTSDEPKVNHGYCHLSTPS
jgi:acyl-CoA reductase-like NAD-dependent aldehyde dehydrogenase